MDGLLRGINAGHTVRVVAAVATDVVREGCRRHGLRGVEAIALGRALCAGCVMVTLTKHESERVRIAMHADGPIGQGRIAKNSIVCPWHFFRFDLTTGRPVATESIMRLRRFPVSISRGSIWIELERDVRSATEGAGS